MEYAWGNAFLENETLHKMNYNTMGQFTDSLKSHAVTLNTNRHKGPFQLINHQSCALKKNLNI